MSTHCSRIKQSFQIDFKLKKCFKVRAGLEPWTSKQGTTSAIMGGTVLNKGIEF